MPGKVVAVIPAAGKGTRLVSSEFVAPMPKVFTSIAPGVSPWTILRAALKPLVDHIELVLAPPAAKLYSDALEGIEAGVGISTQYRQLGMGDAVFCADWHDADTIVVIWGDQIGLNANTVDWVLVAHRGEDHRVVVPVVNVPNPYVEYIFDFHGQLSHIKQTREGDATNEQGFSDVGVFVLSTGGLRDAWIDYLITVATGGEITGEVNFLPFLVYLAQHAWEVTDIVVGDPDEARGLNTPEDLEWARERFAK